MTNSQLSIQLFNINAIKFGDFTLKSGKNSPFYLDLRTIISYPSLLKDISFSICERIPNNIQRVCGVPYAALPLATIVSQISNLPLIIKRKEQKEHGTKKLIEGEFNQGDEILLLEDVITSGVSLIETIKELENQGLVIKKIITLVDRQQGGLVKIKEMGYDIETIMDITTLIDSLHKENLINESVVEKIYDYLNKTKSFKKLTNHPKGQKLIDIAWKKKSNIIASIDLTKSKDIINLINQIGHLICAVKLHCDIIEDFSKEFITEIKSLSKSLDFMIIEDRKFADIGNTQLLQLTKGYFSISDWADFITIHLISGEASLKAIQDWDSDNKPGLIPIIEMSSQGALTDINYQNKCKEFVYKYEDVVGMVCQNFEVDTNFLKFTPGINISVNSDDKGQNYNTPEFAINNLETDFLIIGRGIYNSPNPIEEINKYLSEIRRTQIFFAIKNDYQYVKALQRLDTVFDSLPNTPKGEEALKLVDMIEEWENKMYPIE